MPEALTPKNDSSQGYQDSKNASGKNTHKGRSTNTAFTGFVSFPSPYPNRARLKRKRANTETGVCAPLESAQGACAAPRD